jgi:hypothetical protein
MEEEGSEPEIEKHDTLNGIVVVLKEFTGNKLCSLKVSNATDVEHDLIDGKEVDSNSIN